MTPVKNFINTYVELVLALANKLWKSEGRDNNGLAPAKQVILRLSA